MFMVKEMNYESKPLINAIHINVVMPPASVEKLKDPLQETMATLVKAIMHLLILMFQAVCQKLMLNASSKKIERIN